MTSQKRRLFEFGPYRLDVEKRLLFRGVEVISLTPKTFELLILLVESDGRALSRQELMKALWPDAFVEEANLTFQISALRKALKEEGDWIETVPRHGYRFAAPSIRAADDIGGRQEVGGLPTKPHRPKAAAFIGLLCLSIAAVAVWRLVPTRTDVTRIDLIRLTSDSGLTTDPAVSSDGRLFAYASDRANARDLDIWVSQFSGGDPIRITNDEADDYEPDFSPDGTRIVFRSERDGGGIYVSAVFGGPQQLLAKHGRRPRFSPDGKWVAYWVGWPGHWHFGEGTGKIFVVSSAGGTPRDLRPDFGSARYPVWSPDGSSLLFAGSRAARAATSLYEGDWHVTPLDEGAAGATGTFRLFEQEGLLPAPGSVWAPSQWLRDRVIFSARAGDSSNLWQIPWSAKSLMPNGPPQRMTFGTGTETKPAIAAAVSNDERIPLVFASLSANMDIWSLPLPTDQRAAVRQPDRLTHDAGADFVNWLTPDGRKLGFVTNRSGKFQVWIKDMESGREAPLSVVPEPLASRVSVDGSVVGYVASLTGRPSIYMSSLSGGIAEKLCDECGSFWHWTSDRRRVIYVTGGDRAYFETLELPSGQRVEFLRDPDFHLHSPQFSPDDRWIQFTVRAWLDRKQIFIVPFVPGRTLPKSQWIAVTGGGAWEDAVVWSPDGNRLYFLSERDGFRCIWGQELDSATKDPVGQAFPVYHSHRARLSILNLEWGRGALAVSRDRVAFGQGELTGNIWMTKLPVSQ